MIYIDHRRNTILQLKDTPTEYGVEVDIRSYKDQLILHHEPYLMGESFENWLKHFRHQFLILNVKEEGLEERIIKLMKKFNIRHYFFLDQSFPFLIKWSRFGESKCAVRVSEFESIETALTLKGRIDWIWVDYFNYFPLSKESANKLKSAGFKLCLVSPELQGYPYEIEIPKLAHLLKDQEIFPEAICTKKPEIWKKWFLGIKGDQTKIL